MPPETHAPGPRNYTRWTTTADGALRADLVGCRTEIHADTTSGHVLLDGARMDPDHARMVGVRLVEAAALADGPRAIRATGGTR